MIKNVMDLIGSQFEEFIEESLPTYIEDMPEQLDGQGWMHLEPWNKLQLNYEYARFTVLQLTNFIDLITGDSFHGDTFADELAKALKPIVQQKIAEYYKGIKAEKEEAA